VKSGRHIIQFISALAVLFLLLAPVCLHTAARAAGTPNDVVAEESLIQQIAEQDGAQPDASDGAELSDGLANGTGEWPTPPTTDPDDTVKWLIQAPGEAVKTMLPGAVTFLVDFLRDFVLNPNIAIDGVGQTDNGLGQLVAAISPSIKQISQIMYAISIDLILLLFILAIWRYWLEHAWRGGGNHFAPIARLIWTAGVIIAWPTIYAFEVELSNEMIHAIFFKTQAELDQLGNAIGIVLAGIISALVGLALQALGPLIGILAVLPLGAILGPAFGGFIGFVGGLMFLIPGTIIILELVALVVLKSIQTAVLIAQYMFAPAFLVFFASPDTEYIPKTFVKSFIEVSMWTFIWVGLLRILVIVMNSNTGIWAEFLLVIGILQMMLSAPEFMSRAHISPVSELLTAGLLIRGLQRSAQNIGQMAPRALGAFSNLGTQGAVGGLKSTPAATTAGLVAAGALAATAGAHSPSGPQLEMFPGTQNLGNAPPKKPGTEEKKDGTPGQNGTNPGDDKQLKFPFANDPNDPNKPPGGPGGGGDGSGGGGGGTLGGGGGRSGGGGGGAANQPPPRDPNAPVNAGRQLLRSAGPAAEGLATEPDTPLQPEGLQNMAYSNWTGRNMMGAFLRVLGQRALYGLGIRMGPSTDGQAHFEADARTGEITNMNTPVPDPKDKFTEGAQKGQLKPNSASSFKEAGWALMAGMANHLALDSAEGKQAARNEAINSGAARPQNASESVMEASLRAGGRRFEDTDLAKNRVAQAMHNASISGIQSYLNGEKGNAVTDYFRKTHGENRAGLVAGGNISQEQVDQGNAFQPMLQNLLRRESDSTNPDSGKNPDQRGISSFIDPNGYQPNNLTRAVAANPYLRQLPRGLQRAAFEGAWDSMNGIQARANEAKKSEQRALGKPETGLTDDEVIDLWHETAPKFSESKIKAMMSMRSAGMSTADPQKVQDVAEIGQAMGGNIPAYVSTVGLGLGLANSLANLRPALSARPNVNGGTLGALVSKCNAAGLDLKEPEIMQAVVADVTDGVPITSQSAKAMMAIQASHRAGTSPTDRTMVADVAEIGRQDGNYDRAVGLVADMGTPAVRAAFANGTAHASLGGSLPAAVIAMKALGLSPNNQSHTQAVTAIIEGQHELNNANVATQVALQQHDGLRGSSPAVAASITQIGQAMGGNNGAMQSAPAVFADLNVDALTSKLSPTSSFGRDLGGVVMNMGRMGLRADNANDRRIVTMLASTDTELTSQNVQAAVQLERSGGQINAQNIAAVATVGNVVGNLSQAPAIVSDFSNDAIRAAQSAPATAATYGSSAGELVMRMSGLRLQPANATHRQLVTMLAEAGAPLNQDNVQAALQIQNSGGAINAQSIAAVSSVANLVGNASQAPAIISDFSSAAIQTAQSTPAIASSYGSTPGEVVMRMSGLHLQPTNANHRQIVTVLAENGMALNQDNVQAALQIQNSGGQLNAQSIAAVSSVASVVGNASLAPAILTDFGSALQAVQSTPAVASTYGSTPGEVVMRMSGLHLQPTNASHRQIVTVLAENGLALNQDNVQAAIQIQSNGGAVSRDSVAAITSIGTLVGNVGQAPAILTDFSSDAIRAAQATPAIAASYGAGPSDVVMRMHGVGLNATTQNHRKVVTILADQGQALTRANVETVLQLQAIGAPITAQTITDNARIGQVIGGNFREAPTILNDFNPTNLPTNIFGADSSYGAGPADLVVRMQAMNLRPTDQNNRRVVTVLMEGGHELNRRNVETVLQLQATGNSTAPAVVNSVAGVSQALGGRPSDYGTAIDIQKEWGDLGAHLGQGQLANVPDLPSLVVQCRSNRLDMGNRAIRQAVHVMVEGGNAVNDSTSQAITAIYKYNPTDQYLQSSGHIAAIAEIGAADGGRPQNYTNAIGVYDSTQAIEQMIESNAQANNTPAPTGVDGVHTVVKQLHSSGVNVQHPQVQTVVVETIESEGPQMFADPVRLETVVKGISLAANNVAPQSLQASDVTIAMRVASEATQSHFDPNNQRGVVQTVQGQLPNTLAALPQYFDPAAPNTQVNQAQADKNLNLAALAMKNIRDELAGKKRPPRR